MTTADSIVHDFISLSRQSPASHAGVRADGMRIEKRIPPALHGSMLMDTCAMSMSSVLPGHAHPHGQVANSARSWRRLFTQTSCQALHSLPFFVGTWHPTTARPRRALTLNLTLTGSTDDSVDSMLGGRPKGAASKSGLRMESSQNRMIISADWESCGPSYARPSKPNTLPVASSLTLFAARKTNSSAI